MASSQMNAFWHRESFLRFLNEQLPELLSDRLPLEAYSAICEKTAACRIELTLANTNGQQAGTVNLTLDNIPCPDENGIFVINGTEYVSVPIADREQLDTAEIKCVGELLYEFIEPRIGEAPAELHWTEELARSWLPLDKWIMEFFTETAPLEPGQFSSGQQLDSMNWISRHEHPRRLLIPGRKNAIDKTHFNRICPIQTPEGPNVGKVVAIARGAVIKDQRLVTIDPSPQAALSLTASMIPFLEHDEPVRALMGSNMLRQWIPREDPEPAYVQTGFEPDEPGFWNGNNLLTAFVALGESTYEDGIVISESCAKKFNINGWIEPGDKISNRHGTKGVISDILPDEKMPHLQDGTPVELVYSFIGQHTRMNFGQLKEAVMGRIARKTGNSAVVPPFQAPSSINMQNALREAGLDPSGMEQLKASKTGPNLKEPSTVGYVYWGITIHLARNKVFSRPKGYQRQGQMEYFQLRDIRAHDVILDIFNTGSAFHENPETLPDDLAGGWVQPKAPPTPAFHHLVTALNAASIQAHFINDTVRFALREPDGDVLELAYPVRHPWLTAGSLEKIGKINRVSELGAVEEASSQAGRLLKGHAPPRLQDRAARNLQAAVDRYFDALLDHRELRLSTRITMSGRSVIAPGKNLRHDQAGIPDKLAWALFEPLLRHRLNLSKDESLERTREHNKILDDVMAGAWIILNRAPSLSPTCLLAFHPVRIPENVIRIHPFACPFFNGDFDGDQLAVILPVTEAGQREAGLKLSIAGHLQRDPHLIRMLRPRHEAMLGITRLSLSRDGRRRILDISDQSLLKQDDRLDAHDIEEALSRMLQEKGVDYALDTAEALMLLGFRETWEAGISHAPFVPMPECAIGVPRNPTEDDCRKHAGLLEDFLVAMKNDLGTIPFRHQLLTVISNARGQTDWLVKAYLAQIFQDISGNWAVHPAAFCSGLDFKTYVARAAAARMELGCAVMNYERIGKDLWRNSDPSGVNVLARAARSETPGSVFARAAAIGETDPLTDPDSRLFCGLKPL